MNPRLAKALINGCLVALTVVALFPLLWMLSVSFMQTGAASSLPPPLLPTHPTLGNYQHLFAFNG
ncbi:MAG TPA: carbohydrate ABC transporter permease, partial [Oleiagrimonas sp.]|nr:carbohydrate ABC transporter permease [Oleiagrimonas sp.]